MWVWNGIGNGEINHAAPPQPADAEKQVVGELITHPTARTRLSGTA